ncbi:MAG: PAS domain S-box protein [Thermodesulfobacteriota bacterium]
MMAKKLNNKELIKRVEKLEKEIAEYKLRDITKSKRVEDEIRNLTSAVEQSIDGIAISDLELKLIYLNKAFAEMHGYAADEMVGMKTTELVEKEGRDKYKFGMSQVMELGSWTGEIRHTRKDKTSFPVYMSVTLLKDGEGKFMGILGIARDISKQKMMEDEMRIRDNAIASSINAIAFSSLDGYVTYANDSYLKMWGYDDEKEVLGKFNAEFWRTEDEPMEGLEALVSRGSWIGELVGKRKDGSLFDVQLSSSIVKDDSGKPICMMASFLDISQNKRAEHALRERETDLEIKTKSLEEVNTALRVLLKKRDDDKTEIEEKILINVKELVVPYLEKLKKSRLNADQLTYMHILESNLNNIVSSFSRNLYSKYLKLTPTEIQVANLVKEGNTTKQIAELMNLSTRTIESYRKNLRLKIGINNKKVNLISYLSSLS